MGSFEKAILIEPKVLQKKARSVNYKETNITLERFRSIFAIASDVQPTGKLAMLPISTKLGVD